jgi:hypothetical protein
MKDFECKDILLRYYVVVITMSMILLWAIGTERTKTERLKLEKTCNCQLEKR